ncbi:hypothetical protein LEP1GSC109_2561 [Leptospira interrogans str. UI 13372]|nr:hypothetical protein LEP1GSC109_2561 [Leptospira interrogans str. UI 13372]
MKIHRILLYRIAITIVASQRFCDKNLNTVYRKVFFLLNVNSKKLLSKPGKPKLYCFLGWRIVFLF